MSQKKTIQLANGLAEEGDRVMNIGTNPIRRGRKGEFFSPNGHGYFVLDDSGETHPLLEFDEWIILFSPTDALEAVEEAEREIEFLSPEQIALLKDMRDRIQQKHKGHE